MPSAWLCSSIVSRSASPFRFGAASDCGERRAPVADVRQTLPAMFRVAPLPLHASRVEAPWAFHRQCNEASQRDMGARDSSTGSPDRR